MSCIPTILSLLQSLLCSQSLNVASALPVLEPLAEAGSIGLAVRVLCSTRLGKHEEALDQLLQGCPEAAVVYAQHELQDDRRVSYFWSCSVFLGVILRKMLLCVDEFRMDQTSKLSGRAGLALHLLLAMEVS